MAENDISTTTPTQPQPPKRVFIVPYRNRCQQKFFFSKYMSFLLENKDDYEIYFSHQCDARNFNRGAVKNIGFMAIREKYPNDYKNITFIFNDVDTIPFNKIFDYETDIGVVKHYYGFKYALGGIVVIKGYDFERINGFPCYWGWGMEDNALQKRCEYFNITIDRSKFYEVGSPEILQLFDGISRIISKNDHWRGENDDGIDGLSTIRNLIYTIDTKSANPSDNIFIISNPQIFIIIINTFTTHIPFGQEDYYTYDLREPKQKLINPDKLKATKKTVSSTNDWANIPYYPTEREKRINTANHLAKMGRPIPPTLLRQLKEDTLIHTQTERENNNVIQRVNGNVPFPSTVPPNLTRYVQPPRPPIGRHSVPHKYSREYANYVGAKPRATTSAHVRLGGVY